MKLFNRMTGTPVTPDYETLVTALTAAQSETRTGRAARAIRPHVEDPATLRHLLAAIDSATADAAALGHRFARLPPAETDGDAP